MKRDAGILDRSAFLNRKRVSLLFPNWFLTPTRGKSGSPEVEGGPARPVPGELFPPRCTEAAGNVPKAAFVRFL